MRNMMKKAAQNVKAVAVRAGMLMKDTKGENYVDTAVKILIAVVLGALLLAGLYALFGDVVMPTLTQRIQDMTFMARLPLYVILLMISVTMVIKLMPVSALKEKRKSMIK